MKAVVFQGEGVGGFPERSELISIWKDELAGINQIESIEFYRKQRDEPDPEGVIGDAEIVLGTFIPDNFLCREFLDRHPNLRYISTQSHGFGYIDMSLLRERNIVFTNTVYGDITIAQFAFALLLDICHDVGLHDRYYRNGYWEDNIPAGATPIKSRQIELFNKTFGIIGLGYIGLCAARIAQSFGMKVISYSRHEKSGEQYAFIDQVNLEELYRDSDAISIHCPLTEETRGMLDADAFAKMKDGVIILNTARGEIIDEDALITALNSSKVYAAGLDVLSGEPLKSPSSLMNCSNARITPHMAWAPPEAKIRAVKMEARTLKRWIRGEPVRNIAIE